MTEFNNYQQMVETTIDLDAIKNHLYLIKSSFKPELTELREQLDEIEGKIQKLADKVCFFIPALAQTIDVYKNYFRSQKISIDRLSLTRTPKTAIISEYRERMMKF